MNKARKGELVKCRTVTDLMPEWSIGRLDPATSTALDEHLATCVQCHTESESYRCLVEEIDLGGEVIPSSRMRQNIRELVESERRGLLWRRLSYAAIAAMVIGAMTITLLSRAPRTNEVAAAVATIATDELRVIHARSGDRNEVQLRALLEADASPAIRIAALDSLLQISSPTELRRDLERALDDETSPIVRAAMVSVLEELE